MDKPRQPLPVVGTALNGCEKVSKEEHDHVDAQKEVLCFQIYL